MALPILPLVLLLAGGAALAMKSKSGSVAANAPATLQPGTGLYDRTLPLVLETTTTDMIVENTSAAQLQQFAISLLPDWPIAAKALDVRAAALGAGPLPAVPVSTQPPTAAPAAPSAPVFAAPSAPAPSAPAAPSSSASSVAPWDQATMGISVSLPAIPASYAATSSETTAIQNALNAWADAAAYPGGTLTVDGSYGPATQENAAAFQIWQNTTAPASNLTVDGLAGPATQNFLLDFGAMTAGGY